MSSGRRYTDLYFDDIVEEGLRQLREDMPDFRETSPKDPIIALLRRLAAFGHKDASIQDIMASEVCWATQRRRSSAIANAAEVGQRLNADSPASVEILADLSRTPGPSDVLIPALALFRTNSDAENAAAIYENQDGERTAGALTLDIVSEEATVVGSPATTTLAAPWATPAAGDAIYFGHRELLFNRVTFSTAGAPTGIDTVFEYFDGGFRSVQPDSGSVSSSGSGIRMEVDGLLDETSNYTGLRVTVRHQTTGESETVPVQYSSGSNFIVTTGILGQTALSTVEDDYRVSADWLPFGGVAEAYTGGADVTNVQVAELPQDESEQKKWQKTTIAGISAYWIRQRIRDVTTPTGPTSVSATVHPENTWTVAVDTLQGQTVSDILGVTTGNVADRYQLNEGPYIEGSWSSLLLGSDPDYELVESLYASEESDKHFRLVEAPDETRYLEFGDGVNGVLPGGGQVLTGVYRIGADVNGNVAAGAVAATDSSTAFITNIRNPHAATGWTERQGNSPDGIARVNRIVPGVFRARDRAVTPEDHEYLAVSTFQTADGRKPFSRVVAIEQGAGYKTLLLVCVGTGGTQPAAADLSELEEWFNGTTVGYQRFGGRTLANQRIVAVAFTPVSLTFTLTATVAKAYASQAESILRGAIAAAFTPSALDANGNYRWVPGKDIELGGAITAISQRRRDTDPVLSGVLSLTFSSPTFPVSLGPQNLPEVNGTPNVTVTPV